MLAYTLMKTARNLKCKLDRELKVFDITSSQFAVMNQIENLGNQTVAHEIADILDYDRPTISAIIQRLYQAKIIVKTKNPNDRRTQYISLSEHGIKVLDQLRKTADEVSTHIFRKLTLEEQEHLITLLNQINQALEVTL